MSMDLRVANVSRLMSDPTLAPMSTWAIRKSPVGILEGVSARTFPAATATSGPSNAPEGKPKPIPVMPPPTAKNNHLHSATCLPFFHPTVRIPYPL